MSTETRPETKESTSAPPPASGPMGRGGPGSFGMPLERSKDFGGTLRRLTIRLLPQWYRFVAVVVLSITSVTLTVLGPKLLGDGTNVIVKGLFHGGPGAIDFSKLHQILFLVVLLYLGAGTAQYIQAFTLAGVVQRTMQRLRSDVEDKLNRVPLQYVDRSGRGEILSRVTNDIDNLAQSLQQTMSQMLTNVFMLVGTVVMMFVISPVLAVVAIVTIPVSTFIIRFIAARARVRFTAQWDNTGLLNGLVEETLTGHAIVKTFGREREVEAEFQRTNNDLFEASYSAQSISSSIQPSMILVGNLNFVAIAVIGGLKVASHSLSIGGVQAFIQYSRQFAQPLSFLASMANLFQSGLASAERVFEFLDAEEFVPDAVGAVGPDRAKGRVVFDHVSFSYDPDRPLITDLSLVAEPGQTVAIVGPTGAGKTTLVNLIMRFYDVDSGAITLDGQDISKMPRSVLRSNIGMVLQDTWLFAGSIRDNIAYGNLDASEEQILAAAQAAYVDRFVHGLSHGYDTVVDDEGTAVSAGEKQLLTIARAFVANPCILILDEATSSVDTRTEVLIQNAMEALRAERTSFVIAHRLSTVRNADVILVMEDGQIVEVGHHTDLLRRDGAYARLYNAQFTGAAVEVT